MSSLAPVLLALLPIVHGTPVEETRADAPAPFTGREASPRALPPGPPATQEPFQDMTPKEALAVSAGTGKVAVVAFHTSWDGESRRMRELTWGHPRVRAWLAEETVAVTVDGEAQPELALEWKVTTYPVVILLRPDGRVVERIKGYLGPEEFLDLARAAIAGKLTGAIPSLDGERALDPMVHLQRAGALYVNTRIEECLDEYLWCLDRSDDSDPTFLDRNLDFILKKVMTLGRTTARALSQLIERRDGLTIRAFAGLLGERQTRHLVRYNFWMRHEYRTLAVFDELAGRGEKQDASRRVIFPHVLDQLVGHRRYADALDYAGQPMDWIGPLMEQQRTILAASTKRQQEGEAPSGADEPDGIDTVGDAAAEAQEMSATDAAHLRELRQEMALMTGLFYEALLGTGRGKDADELVALITEFHATGRIYSLFIQHALRLEMAATARRLERQGLAILPEKGRRLVQRAARKIPADGGDAPAPVGGPPPAKEGGPSEGSGQGS